MLVKFDIHTTYHRYVPLDIQAKYDMWKFPKHVTLPADGQSHRKTT